MRHWTTIAILLGAVAPLDAANVTLVESGQARAVICAPGDVMRAPGDEPTTAWRTNTPVAQQLRLRESIKDLAATLEQMTGSPIEIVEDAIPDDGRIPILIGTLGAERFGPPSEHAPLKQAYRIVVTPTAIGLIGESDLATSYAIYDLLDRLGCRWYMPGELGAVIPQQATLAVAEMDQSLAPYTIYRGIWYTDAAYARRNRMGGLQLAANHALELIYLKKEQLEQNPQWIGTVDGKPSKHRYKWSAPGLADAIADSILDRLKMNPEIDTVSLSPDDGLGYDNSPEDRALDAGDYDPSIQEISITDRQLWFCNQIVERVTAKHPDVLFGMLAYGLSTRPPVREKPHANLIPQIAPITYARAQPMTDDGEPNNKDYRALVEGWGRVSEMTSYYLYGWFLAEPSAPNPFIRKWSVNIPIIYDKGRCRFWQPETTSNFESTMHALYLGNRMALDPTQDPAAIIDELHEKFYGKAAEAMAAYWHFIDDVWVDTPEYAGCGFGHMRRWTPHQMGPARELLDAAAAAAATEIERARIELADDSLILFELFMKLRHDLADGNWASLAEDVKRYRQMLIDLADKHESSYAFGRMRWTGRDTLYGRYFQSFYQHTYDDAARVAAEFDLLTPALRKWRYKVDEQQDGEASGWHAIDTDDASWPTTDVCVDTWSALGLHSFMGAMWYRQNVDLPATGARKVYLWVGAADQEVKLFVNGKHVPYVNDKGEVAEQFVGYCRPASFEITEFIQPGASNQIAIKSTRSFINELGTGGLLAPVVVYAQLQ